MEYVDSIMADVRWLGFDWGDRLFYASDYFEELYRYAVHLIEQGNAYVDSLTAEEMREYRGTLMQPGADSPYRSRPVDENLAMFARMRAGEFPDGAHVLRAKIDMASPNINMRDPVLYRIVARTITARATRGASIRCTTSRILHRTRSRRSPIRSALWNSRIIGLSTTG